MSAKTKPEEAEKPKGNACEQDNTAYNDNQYSKLSLSRPSVGIDVDYYQSAIDDPDVSEERKRELIEIIGAIVVNFIDMGFGVHPVQLAQKEKQADVNTDTDSVIGRLIELSETETPSLQPNFEQKATSERSDV